MPQVIVGIVTWVCFLQTFRYPIVVGRRAIVTKVVPSIRNSLPPDMVYAAPIRVVDITRPSVPRDDCRIMTSCHTKLSGPQYRPDGGSVTGRQVRVDRFCQLVKVLAGRKRLIRDNNSQTADDPI